MPSGSQLGHGRGQQFHFRIRRQGLNWDPRGLGEALTLISASIHNVRSFALWRNGSDPSGLSFAIPEGEDFGGPLGRIGGIDTNNIDGVLRDAVRLFEREELEEELVQAFDNMRQALDPE